MNGSISRRVELLSGIPEGSVLGLILFVLFINDITDSVKFNIHLFADDTTLFREVPSRNDRDRLQ